MNITQIPFNKYINICREPGSDNTLELAFSDEMKNHIGTFHASAQFALAEACSGLALQNRFSDIADSAVPILRRSETKFKKPASSDIKAKAVIDDVAEIKFREQLESKGRATISVSVEISDANGKGTMSGNYEWFVQNF